MSREVILIPKSRYDQLLKYELNFDEKINDDSSPSFKKNQEVNNQKEELKNSLERFKLKIDKLNQNYQIKILINLLTRVLNLLNHLMLIR